MIDEDYEYDIFVSYSHRNADWIQNWLLPRLESADLRTCVDYRDFEIGRPSLVNMEQAVERSRHVLLILTPAWIESEWTNFEALMAQTSDPMGVRRRILPLMLESCEPPGRLAMFTYADLRRKDHRDAELNRLLRQIAGLKTERPIGLTQPEICIAKLPSTNPLLLGRDVELAILDEAWADPNSNIVAFVAFGGVGKTALVNKWLLQTREDGFRQAELVYGWSFYSQGTSEDNQASADEFIATALPWFGDPDPTVGSPWDKGERLARLVRKKRTLLILDGLEPLQYPPGDQCGRLRDPGVQSLLRELAIANPGLCVVSTRLPVEDLKDFAETTVTQVNLDKLSDAAGAELLKQLGCKGSLAELEQAARDFDDHALALTLLGKYLQVVHQGDVRKRQEVPALTTEAARGGHAHRAMECYERWFAGKPELSILRIMGLFDRPAIGSAIEALRAEPPIKNLTADLHGLPEADWKFALHNLRNVGLLAEPDPKAPDTLDCHPLIREHFADRVRNDYPEALRTGHNRLYEYFKGPGCPEVFPDTIEEMAPLFVAVSHGCQAGRWEEVWHEVYDQRICRGRHDFTTHQLGAIGAELAVLASFFEQPWVRPVQELSEEAKTVALCNAGYCLRARGCLVEAVTPIEHSLARRVKMRQWQRAATNARNLSELHLILGNVAKALESARQGVKLAAMSHEPTAPMLARGCLAVALHEAGRLDEAEQAFDSAEGMQKELLPQCPVLYSLRGYHYCDLLLGKGRYQQVLGRASRTLSWVSEAGWVLDMALDHLSLGRAHLLKCQIERTSAFSAVAEELDRSVQGLRQAGEECHLPRGLLARAEYYRVRGERQGGGDWFDQAHGEVNEAMLIATRGQMRLYECDCHRERARLYLVQGQRDEARQHFDIGKKMVNEMGYHRRDTDLENLEGKL